MPALSAFGKAGRLRPVFFCFGKFANREQPSRIRTSNHSEPSIISFWSDRRIMSSVKSSVGILAITGFALCLCYFATPVRAQEQLGNQDPQLEAAIADFKAARKEVSELINHREIYGNETLRTELGPKLIPGLHRMVD